MVPCPCHTIADDPDVLNVCPISGTHVLQVPKLSVRMLSLLQDVFGRNTFGGGGMACNVALQAAHAAGES